jgi:glycosyltransferase involved in cell wall biosynthesis
MSTIVESPGYDESEPGPSLRIGMVAPPWFEVPPRAYGGTEAVVGALVDQLAERGHEVTLVGAGTGRTSATRFVSAYPEPPSALLGTSAVPEVVLAAEAARAFESADLDIVHDHSLAGPLLARGRTVPTVVTVHGPVGGAEGDYYERLGTSVHFVAISDAQRAMRPDLNWAGRVYNGIDVSSFPFESRKEPDVLWIGRFSPTKGAHLAIDAARKAGRRIILAGKLSEPPEHEYFREAIAPRLGPDAEYVGEADAVLKRELFARSSCLVFPIQWDEPFGMVMAEAMACGTPVVATRRGSVPELVVDGVTGFIVDSLDDLPAAIARASELDPAASRARAKECFDLPVMAEGYERVYLALLEDDLRQRRSERRAA